MPKKLFIPKLLPYDRAMLRSYTHPRAGETKLGEVIVTGDQFSASTRYVIFGIPEDIGIRANHGTGGAHTAWPAFLNPFLNIQSINGFSGEAVGLLGHLDCSDLMEQSLQFSLDELRKAVELIDREVEQIAFEIASAGRIPIVIGGGHNNAYPIIKGTAQGLEAAGKTTAPKINCINLDAHTDFRALEGRHSGNGFRYAFREGFLDRYAVVGLHRNYNAQTVMDVLDREERIEYSRWEDIFLKEQITYRQAVDQAIAFTSGRGCGIELDLDAVENVLCSARTPSGVSPTLARQFIHWTASAVDPAYLHICEGAVQLESGRQDNQTGKLTAYLVSDFIQANRQR